MSMLKKHGKKRQFSQRQETKSNKRTQIDNEEVSSSRNLLNCSICNRRFTEDRLKEHERVCQKSKTLHANQSHRYHYNSQLHRWKGLNYGINAYRRTINHLSTTHWKEKHQTFQNAAKGQYTPANEFLQIAEECPYQCARCQRKFAMDIALTKHQKGCAGQQQMSVKSRANRNKTSK